MEGEQKSVSVANRIFFPVSSPLHTMSLSQLVLTPVSARRPQQTRVGLSVVVEESNTEQSPQTERSACSLH